MLLFRSVALRLAGCNTKVAAPQHLKLCADVQGVHRQWRRIEEVEQAHLLTGQNRSGVSTDPLRPPRRPQL